MSTRTDAEKEMCTCSQNEHKYISLIYCCLFTVEDFKPYQEDKTSKAIKINSACYWPGV